VDDDDFDLTDLARVRREPMEAATASCHRAIIAVAIAADARSRGDHARALEAMSRARRHAESMVVLLGVLAVEMRGAREP
jgi:hypothetical protein